MKKSALMVGAIIVVMLVSLVAVSACSSSKANPTKTPATTTSVTPSNQAQVDNLSKQISELKSQLSELKARMDALPKTGTDTTSLRQSIDNIQKQLNTLTNTVNANRTSADSKLAGYATADEVNALLASINQFKADMEQFKIDNASSVSIGTESVKLDNLEVTYIRKESFIATVVGSSTVSTQLAVKISNISGSNISNVDIVGKITFKDGLYGILPGFPTVADAGGSVYYNAYFNGEDTINFEVYEMLVSGKKVNVSIPAGTSLTLRPKVTLQALPDDYIEDVNMEISLISITYDKGG